MAPPYTNLHAAAAAMAACNGDNRISPDKCDTILAYCEPDDLAAVNEWLGTLTDDQLLVWVDGDAEDIEAMAATAPPLAHEMFDELFMAICDGGLD